MKKYFVMLTAALTTVTAYSQGTVNFANSSATAVSNSLTFARVSATAGAFRVALYFLPDTGITPTTELFDAAGMVVGVTNFFAPGLFNQGEVRVNAVTPNGGNGWFQVRAWELAFGSTYELARDNMTPSGGRLALIGTSIIMKIDTADPTAVPPGTATPLTSATFVNPNFRSFYVSPVPEPSTLALGALGLSALLFLRRRKQ